MDAVGWMPGYTGLDNSVVRTGRYEDTTKGGKRRKTYPKYHVAAVLGLQMPETSIAPSAIHDTKVLIPLPETAVRRGVGLGCPPTTAVRDTAGGTTLPRDDVHNRPDPIQIRLPGRSCNLPRSRRVRSERAAATDCAHCPWYCCHNL